MTKLSFVLDHDIRCWILGSSSILQRDQSTLAHRDRRHVLVELMDKRRLHDFRLLRRRRGPHGLSRGVVARIGSFGGAIGGVCGGTVARAGVSGRLRAKGTGGRGRSVHGVARRLSRGREDRHVSRPVGSVRRPRERTSRRRVADTAHGARAGTVTNSPDGSGGTRWVIAATEADRGS